MEKRDIKKAVEAKRAVYDVVIVDDHPLMREGIANLLRTQPDFRIAGAAGDPEEAITLLRRERADVVLVDLSLRSGSSGFELIERMVGALRDIPALVLSMHDENLYAKRSIEAGRADMS
jgi:DNA-binding NarL/FixJ family response regulator